MSKATRRRVDCYHEAGHAVMAWIEGLKIVLVRLVPDSEQGELSAVTVTQCTHEIPEEWECDEIIAQMRMTLAGPEGKKLGPFPPNARELQFVRWEAEHHFLRALQFPRQFGGGRIKDADIPRLTASALQDVAEAFKKPYVTRCVDAFARELFRRESISGEDAEAFIGNRISDEERKVVRGECLRTSGKTVKQ